MFVICHVIIGLNIGGAERLLQKILINHKSYQNTKSFVISLTSLGPIGRELQDNGIKVYHLNLTSALNLPSVIFKLRKILIFEKVNVLQTWMYHADLIGSLASISTNINCLIWNVRSFDIVKGGSRFTLVVRFLCTLFSYFFPDKIIFPAISSMNLHKSIGYCKRKFEIIPNGFDPNKFSPDYDSRVKIRKNLNLDLVVNVFISIGRYNKVKDHMTFVKSALVLLESRQDVHFILVGRDLDYNNRSLVEYINLHNKLNFFSFVGEVDNVSVYLAASDFFCLHSITESFPNVLGEAMLTCLPCISTDVGDARYLLSNDNFIVKPTDHINYSLIMDDLCCKNFSERNEIGLQNRLRIIENFNLEDTYSKYYFLYVSYK